MLHLDLAAGGRHTFTVFFGYDYLTVLVNIGLDFIGVALLDELKHLVRAVAIAELSEGGGCEVVDALYEVADVGAGDI